MKGSYWLNITHFQTFIQVVTDGSFAGAAKRLELTQPAVTMHVQKLEDALGISLFAKQGRGVELTAAGQTVFTEAQQIIQMMAHFDTKLEQRLSQEKQNVTIGAGPITTAYILPHVIAAFRHDHHDIDVAAVSSETDLIVRGVVDHTFDLGVVGVKVENDKVVLEEWIDDELVLIVPPDHPFTRTGIVGAEELRDQRFVWQKRLTGIRRFVEAKCAESGASIDFTGSKEVDGINSVLTSVHAGLGVSILSKVAASMAIELGKVVRIPIEDCCLIRKIYIVNKKTKKLLPVVEQFRNHMRQYRLPTDQEPSCKNP